MADILRNLYLLGGTIAETTTEFMKYVFTEKNVIPGYDGTIFDFMLALFITVVIPYTIIKWLSPI